MKHIITFFAFLQCSVLTISAQPDMPGKVSFGRSASMTPSANRSVRAENTILFKAGFKARAGCYLLASVTGKKVFKNDPVSDLLMTESMRTPPVTLEVFPNSVHRQINIRGNFNNDPVYIFDSSGNLQFKFFIQGEDPSVDLPAMNKGIYYLRIGQKMARITKE
jgi:hypothetical protein